MNETLIDLGLLAAEPAEEYHAKATQNLSSHQLIDFIRCPWLHCRKANGLIEEKDSPAYLVGRAAHCRILEGRDAYETQFALGGPINPRTQKPFGSTTQAFADWAVKQGKPVVSHEQMELVESMASGVAMNDAAVDLLLHGRAEGVVRANYCGVPCQIRIDWVNPHRGIVDVKSCDDADYFHFDAKRFRYHNQMGFYREVLAQVSGQRLPVFIISVEKKEPYRAAVWRLSEDTLAAARQENEAAIKRLIECRKTDTWPTGFEAIRVLEIL
ncbi:MAG TPA: PD-(D/E)XK nuclease-like domain-containing protein [Planctomycetota bacterium]|nr:PD-(D/E)XK nuclease-like domain-containing protein [Planctomycetota bacterium]